MKKLFLVGLALLFLLIFSANSQIITLGLSPSEFELYGNGTATLNIRFFNTHGDVDAYYTVKPDDCIRPYAVSGFNTDVLVHKGTNANNPKKYQLILNGSFLDKKTCYFYVYGRPVTANETNGTINIERRIGVRVIMGVLPPTTTTTTTTRATTTTTKKATTTTQSGNNSVGLGTTTTSTTTTTHPSTTTTTVFSGIYVNYPPLDNPSNSIVEQPQQKEQQQTTDEPKQGGIVEFFMNTTTGLFTMVGIIVFAILLIMFLSQRGKTRNKDNPFLQDNQGLFPS
jgi:hypothetical protein